MTKKVKNAKLGRSPYLGEKLGGRLRTDQKIHQTKTATEAHEKRDQPVYSSQGQLTLQKEGEPVGSFVTYIDSTGALRSHLFLGG